MPTCYNYGKPNAMNAAWAGTWDYKVNLITFDPIHNGYVAMGKRVGNAFADGKNLK